MSRRTAPPRVGRGVLIVLAVTGLLLAALGLLARAVPAWNTPVLGFVAVGPYLVVGAVLAAVLSAVVRGRVGLAALAVAVVVIAAQVVLQGPHFVASTAPAGARVTVMTANLKLGEADPAAVVRAVRSNDADVVMLEELTAAERSRLRDAGLDATLPHFLGEPRPSASGTGLWSRWPLLAGHTGRRIGYSAVQAKVSVPGSRLPVGLLALHVPSPHPSSQFGRWRRDIATVPALLDVLPDSIPSIAGGDFNATADVVQFRRLLHGGFADAADQAGAGFTPTFPSDTWYGPVLAIDHVLTRGAVATDVHTVTLPGSDHRALVAAVALPR